MSRDRLAEIAGGTLAAAAAWERLTAEARCERVRAFGAAPEDCGPEVPVAPARGPVRVVSMEALYPKGADGWELRPAGWLGRKTAATADVFDRMAAAAARRGKARPLTDRQVLAGRAYRGLVEACGAAGMSCSSLEASGRGRGGAGGGRSEAIVGQWRAVDRMRERIGRGVALRPRRGGAAGREVVFDRVMVDLVCLEELAVSEVLRRHGWAVKGETVARAMRALGTVLDRMAG